MIIKSGKETASSWGGLFCLQSNKIFNELGFTHVFEKLGVMNGINEVNGYK